MTRHQNASQTAGWRAAPLALLALCTSAAGATAQEYRHTFSGIAPGSTRAQIEETFPPLGFTRVSAEPSGAIGERAGRWQVSGRRLTLIYTHKVTDDGWGERVRLLPPQSHTITIEPLSDDRAVFNTAHGAHEYKRCAAPGG
jgi:hypothetical protein